MYNRKVLRVQMRHTQGKKDIENALIFIFSMQNLLFWIFRYTFSNRTILAQINVPVFSK